MATTFSESGGSGGGGATLFSRSNDAIKAGTFEGFVAGENLTTEQWLEKVFYPFISASVSHSSTSITGLGLQEFGTSGTNLKTVSGALVANDETVFTSGAFKLLKDGAEIETFGNPTGSTSWSKSNVDVQPATASGRSTTFKVKVGVGNDNDPRDFEKDLVVNFAPPTFYGLSTTRMTIAELSAAAAGDRAVVSSNNSAHTYSNPLNKFIHIAVPAEYDHAVSGLSSVKIGFYEYWSVTGGATRGLDFVKADRTLSTAAVTQSLTLDNNQSVDYHVYSWNIVWSTNTAPTVVFT